MRKNKEEFHIIQGIDLMFKKTKNSDNLNFDPPDDIQSFTGTVYRQAISSKMFEVYVKSATVHLKTNQPQLLPKHVP